MNLVFGTVQQRLDLAVRMEEGYRPLWRPLVMFYASIVLYLLGLAVLLILGSSPVEAPPGAVEKIETMFDLWRPLGAAFVVVSAIPVVAAALRSSAAESAWSLLSPEEKNTVRAARRLELLEHEARLTAALGRMQER